jgi:hypothetical protein
MFHWRSSLSKDLTLRDNAMCSLRVMFILMLAVAYLPVSGCDSVPTSEKSCKPVNTTVSRMLSIVSAKSLPLIKEMSQSQANITIEFAESGAGIVYIEPVEGKFRVVHNGRAGKLYNLIGHMTISIDGDRIAYVVHQNDTLKKMVVDGSESPYYTDIGMPVFSQDGKHLFYTITQDGSNYVVLDHKIRYKYKIEQDPLFSHDSQFIAIAAKSSDGQGKQFIISDLSLQDIKIFDSCGESFVVSDDGTQLGVVCSVGNKRSIKVIDFQKRVELSASQEHQDGRLARLRISPANRLLAYTYIKSDSERYIVYKGRREQIPTGDEFFSDPMVLSEPEGVGVIIGTVYNAYLYRAFQRQNKKEKGYGYISDFVASKDGKHHAYIATKLNEFQMQIVVDGKEGPKFDKIVSPLFSPDGHLLVYRARQAGKRFLVVSDLKGKILSQHREYDMVFQPGFTADGKSVAYGVLDSNEFWWKVEKL